MGHWKDAIESLHVSSSHCLWIQRCWAVELIEQKRFKTVHLKLQPSFHRCTLHLLWWKLYLWSPARVARALLWMPTDSQLLHKVMQTHNEAPSPKHPLASKLQPVLCCAVEVRQSGKPSGKENPEQVSKSSEVWTSVRPWGWFRRVAEDKAPEVRDHRADRTPPSQPPTLPTTAPHPEHSRPTAPGENFPRPP